MAEIDLEALAERCEKLEGPCRETDLEIARIQGVVCMRRNIDDTANEEFTHWRYTGSIDAALTLLPFDYDWQLNNFDGVTTDYDGHLDNSRPYRACVGGDIEVDHHVPAIALVAAALRARATAAALRTRLMEGEG